MTGGIRTVATEAVGIAATIKAYDVATNVANTVDPSGNAAKAVDIVGATLTRFLCFDSDTPVVLCDGETVPIATIKPGDYVMSRDPDTQELGCQRVLVQHEREEGAMVELRLVAEGGESVVFRTTAEHPFWVDGRGWIRAGELALEDPVKGLEGLWSVAGQELLDEPHTVYNLEVEQWHTFLVGEPGIWVHNGCGGTRRRDVVEHPSKRAARRAAEREAGMGRHGLRERREDKQLHSGSQAPDGPRGIRTETKSPETKRIVHHDPYGNHYPDDPSQDVGPHYGVEGPGISGTSHHTYPSTHDVSTNR